MAHDRAGACLASRRYNGVGSLRYNFYVTPPTGAEYALLVSPTYQSTVVVPTLPIGVNLVRAAAVDAL